MGHRLAERLALIGAVAKQLQCPLRDADGSHAVVDASGPEPRLSDHEPHPLARDQVLGGDPHVLEQQLSVPLGVEVPEHGQAADHRYPGRVDRHQHHRLLLVDGRVGIGLAHHDQDPAIGV